jgi:hypothetical protein
LDEAFLKKFHGSIPWHRLRLRISTSNLRLLIFVPAQFALATIAAAAAFLAPVIRTNVLGAVDADLSGWLVADATGERGDFGHASLYSFAWQGGARVPEHACGLLTHLMDVVLFVFANLFGQVRVRDQVEIYGEAPGA